MDLSAEKVMFRGRSHSVVDFVDGQEIISFNRQDDSVTIQTTQYEYTVAGDKVYRRALSDGFANPSEELENPLGLSENQTPEPILKGGITMKYQDSKGRTKELPNRVLNSFPEEFRNLEIITDKELDLMANDDNLEPRTKKIISTAFAKLKHQLETEGANEETPQDNPVIPATTPESNPASEPENPPASEPENPPAPNDSQSNPADGGVPGGGGLSGASSVFNQNDGEGGSRRSATKTPKTEAEKAAAKALREQKLAEHQVASQTMQVQVQNANSVLAANPQLVEAVENLRKILTNPYGGVIGLGEVVCNTNTRIKGQAINTVQPEDRTYHPNIAAQADMTKTGKDIEQKYALGKYDVVLIESTPGAVTGFVMYVPAGITVDHLSGLTNVMNQKQIADLAAIQSHDMVPIAVNKFVFTQLLSILMVPAYFLSPNKQKDVTRPFYHAEPHPADNGLYWYSLKAVDRNNKVTKLACDGYLPLSTYNTAKLAQSDQKALSQLIWGKLLKNKSTYTRANKFSQLTDTSRALFTGNEENFVYTGFKDMNSVKSYTSTRSNPKTSNLPLPATQMSKASNDKPSTPQFVKSRYNEPGFGAIYSARITALKDVLSNFKRQSGTSQRYEELRKTAHLVAISEMATGNSVRLKKPE